METQYSNWSKDTLYEVLFENSKQMGLPEWINQLLELSKTDISWNPITDFDGCTAVQDMYQPDIACFIHDWLFHSDKGGIIANKIFLAIMLAEGYKPRVANRRYRVVNVAWFIYFKHKKRKQSNITIENIIKIIPKDII